MEINDVLMWLVFYFQMFYVPHILHPGKNRRKLKNFEWEGSQTEKQNWNLMFVEPVSTCFLIRAMISCTQACNNYCKQEHVSK